VIGLRHGRRWYMTESKGPLSSASWQSYTLPMAASKGTLAWSVGLRLWDSSPFSKEDAIRGGKRVRRKKYTRAMVLRAKKALGEVPMHQETLRTWKAAMQQIGEVDQCRVVAIEVAEDGSVRVELAPASVRTGVPEEAPRDASTKGSNAADDPPRQGVSIPAD
jgi:hypothetical protein